MKRAIPLVLLAALTFGGLSSTPAPATTGVWAAKQVDGVPSSFYWAVVLGASDYAGSTADATGSAEDAYAFRDYLLSIGWQADHIYVVTNLSMTRQNVLTAIQWLASKTNNRSLAVFHYSGHEMPFTAQGVQHVSMWAADNRYVMDTELGSQLSRVHPYRMWIDISSCRAAGFADAGTLGAGRIVTWSSPQSELSFSDGALRHSIFGYYEIVQGLRNKAGDSNRDGRVSVEEAFWYARRLTMARTSDRQHPMMSDGVYGDLFISPPKG